MELALERIRAIPMRASRVARAWSEYRRARRHLFASLGLADAGATPHAAVAAQVVAEIVGGVLDPDSGGRSQGVLLPDAAEVAVFASLASGVGGFAWDRRHERFDYTAFVVFEDGVPVAVHLLPRNRRPQVLTAYGAYQPSGLSFLPDTAPVDWLLDPVPAAALGVQTVRLPHGRRYYEVLESGARV